MAKAFQKIYTQITQVTKATCSVKATNVGYDELATVDGKLAQVVKIIGEEVIYKNFKLLLENNDEYTKMNQSNNPYGDGFASKRIADILEKED